eukprot:TRINITY_DN7341_c0_g1_i1.p1 TRINITY_DN7341_c0_g1~~TRINITY_DN7341_c0_g1_i1.p1  ORF type:complete len:342 (-),score=73.34 TRINITY_DN7341_c0_g1_i1:91-1116(-)
MAYPFDFDPAMCSIARQFHSTLSGANEEDALLVARRMIGVEALGPGAGQLHDCGRTPPPSPSPCARGARGASDTGGDGALSLQPMDVVEGPEESFELDLDRLLEVLGADLPPEAVHQRDRPHPMVLRAGIGYECGCFFGIISGERCVRSKYHMVGHGMYCAHASTLPRPPALEISAPMKVRGATSVCNDNECAGGDSCTCPADEFHKAFRFEREVDGDGELVPNSMKVAMSFGREGIYDKLSSTTYSEVYDPLTGCTLFFVDAPALCPKHNGRASSYCMAEDTINTIGGPLPVNHQRRSGATQKSFLRASVRAIIRNHAAHFAANPHLRDAIWAIAPGGFS